jgi:hypothetical protein
MNDKGMHGELQSALATAAPELQNLIRVTMKLLQTEPAPPSSGSGAKASAGAAVAPASSILRAIRIHTQGLLVSRTAEDTYIRSLLSRDGVTSVTIDKQRQCAVVYTKEGDAAALARMKADLYRLVQEACDELQDAAGKQRFKVRVPASSGAAGRSSYLDEEEEAENGAQAAGGTETSAKGRALATNGPRDNTKTAAERLRERQAQAAKTAGGTPATGGGWLSGIIGSFW